MFPTRVVPLINTVASARCRGAPWTGELFQQFFKTDEKPLKPFRQLQHPVGHAQSVGKGGPHPLAGYPSHTGAWLKAGQHQAVPPLPAGALGKVVLRVNIVDALPLAAQENRAEPPLVQPPPPPAEPVLLFKSRIHRPPPQDPTANPSMKTDSTIDNTGVMIPNEANAIRVQTTW